MTRHALLLCVALVILSAQIPIRPVRASLTSSNGYWHTAGTRIVDAHGRPVRIVGVTWYGMESAVWVPAGLNFQRYTTIMDLTKVLGYNTIRLPFSDEMVERNPIVRQGVAANPQFRGRRALDVLDAICAYARRIGLKIILDNHRSRAGRPMGVNTLDEPLWYTASFPESSWIRDWRTLVRRYRSNPAVIGVDLRNEPHTVGSSPWTLNDYLHRGATWGPYSGVDNPATDWRLAAERGGNAVLAVNPNLLVIVEGIGVYPDAGSPHGVESSWWSGLLTPVRRYPVALSVPHRLVYSVHEWGPVKWPMPWFRHMTYAGLVRAWHHAWAYLLDRPSAPYAAPVLLGEFGTCTDRPVCYDTHPGGQAAWFASIVRFIRKHPALNWSFFALNGTNSNDCATDNGLLTWAWNNLRVPGLQSQLTSAGAATHHLPGLGGPGPLFPGTGTRARPRSPRSPLCTLP